MELRQFGNTSLYVTPIVFGAWEIGGPPFFRPSDKRESLRLIQEAHGLGITFYDTAPVYGFGLSEEILGEAVKEFRSHIVISTKCGLSWKNDTIEGIHTNASKEVVIKEAEMSLKRLKTDYIDLYLVHWPDTATKAPIEETMEALNLLKRSGKIRFYGLSNFSTAQMEEAGAFSGLQSQYSMLRLDLEKSELPYCIKNSIGFQAYSPLHRGVLTDKPMEELKDGQQAAIEWITSILKEEEIKKISKIKEIAQSYGVPFAAFVLSWTLARPGVTTAIVGTTKVSHLKEATQAMDVVLSEGDQKEIRAVLEG